MAFDRFYAPQYPRSFAVRNLKSNVRHLASKAAGGILARSSHRAELEDHLYCIIEENMRNGMTEHEAFEQAQKQFGSIELIRTEMNLAYPFKSPAIRWALLAGLVIATLGVLWYAPENPIPSANDLLAAISLKLRWLGVIV